MGQPQDQSHFIHPLPAYGPPLHHAAAQLAWAYPPPSSVPFPHLGLPASAHATLPLSPCLPPPPYFPRLSQDARSVPPLALPPPPWLLPAPHLRQDACSVRVSDAADHSQGPGAGLVGDESHSLQLNHSGNHLQGGNRRRASSSREGD